MMTIMGSTRPSARPVATRPIRATTLAPGVAALALVAGLAVPGLAKPIPLGANGLATFRVRSEVAVIGDPGHHATEHLEIARSGDAFTFEWALIFPDGTSWSEVATAEVRGGLMIPLTVRRSERDGNGTPTLELEASSLDQPVVKLSVARNGGAPEADALDVDDPPLYPPVMTGTLYQALFDAGVKELKFTTLADYPWGLGAAPMEAVIDSAPERLDVALGSQLLRKVTLRPVMPWPLSSMVDAIGIDTAVFLWVNNEWPHRLQRFEGAYRYDSGRFRGDVVEQQDLAEGDRSRAWPPHATATASRVEPPRRSVVVEP
jgi:hypothetical protein